MDINNFHPTEENLLAFFRETLPESDLTVYPETTLRGYARHAAFLWRNSSYCHGISPEMFLHFVSYPRINTEDLTDCRSFFYNCLKERITGLTAENAILEVNRWCAEHVTYQPSDDRTESPLTAYLSGTGRCGEESAFTVSALRSVGIPARQVYVPYWTHCDDNHAWVEAWAGGKWNYLGACEPEPVLNRGWFTNASSRAPMVFYRTFSDCRTDDDDLVMEQGSVRCYSVLPHYAIPHRLTVRVPGYPHANIRFEVLNMGALRQIAGGQTDADGTFSIRLGNGSYHIEVCAGSQIGYAVVTIDDEDRTVEISPETMCSHFYEMDSIAPAASVGNTVPLTPEQIAANQKVLASCAESRAKQLHRMDTFLSSPELPQEWHDIIRQSSTNAPEILRFYGFCNKEHRPAALSLLRMLSPKDLKDTSCDVLIQHLLSAEKYCSSENMDPFVCSPRIEKEKIGPWREIVRYLPQEYTDPLQPENVWKYLIQNHLHENRKYYPELVVPPEHFFSCKGADRNSCAYTMTAILRSSGIPSRLSCIDGDPEYYMNGSWRSISAQRSARIHLDLPQKAMTYGVQYTLSYWTGMYFRVIAENPGTDFAAVPGFYRLVTTCRLPNGNQLGRIQMFSLTPGKRVCIPVKIRTASPEEMLSHYHLEPFSLENEAGNIVESSDLLKSKTILLFLSPGEEPTEHVIMELLQEDLSQSEIRLAAVLMDRNSAHHPQFLRLRSKYPRMPVFFHCSATASLARQMYLEPGVFPLMILTDDSHIGFYGCCGYNVNSVGLAAGLAKIL